MIFVHPLSDEERETLRRLTRQAVGRVAMRAQVILWSDQGRTVPEIAELLEWSPATVRARIKRYEAEGIAGLYDKPRSGRPRKAHEAVQQEVATLLERNPTELGYTATVWTIVLLMSHLASLGWVLSRSTVRRVVHALGYRWRRPRLAVMRRDPQGPQRMAAIGRAIWNLQPGDHIFSVDESEFKLLPVLRAAWTKVGRRLRIPTPAYNASLWVFGAVELCTGQWISGLYDRQTAENFIAFLEQIWAACPNGHIWVIVDHAPAHTAKAVVAWLEAHPRMTVLYLPKYASHLNPIERIWREMKDKVVANHCYTTLAALRQAVQRYLDGITPAMALQTTGLKVQRSFGKVLSIWSYPPRNA